MMRIGLVGKTEDIWNLFEDLSVACGRQLFQFIVERDGEFYLEYPEGVFEPNNLKFIPRYSGVAGVQS